LVSVHRLAFELANPGTETKGKDVCHKCDNPRCVNPEHLFAGTRRENMQDCKAKGRLNHPVKYGEQFIEPVREMLSGGLLRREITRRLGWQWGTLYRFEKRYGSEIMLELYEPIDFCGINEAIRNADSMERLDKLAANDQSRD
jgi:hypothetical protein